MHRLSKQQTTPLPRLQSSSNLLFLPIERPPCCWGWPSCSSCSSPPPWSPLRSASLPPWATHLRCSAHSPIFLLGQNMRHLLALLFRSFTSRLQVSFEIQSPLVLTKLMSHHSRTFLPTHIYQPLPCLKWCQPATTPGRWITSTGSRTLSTTGSKLRVISGLKVHCTPMLS